MHLYVMCNIFYFDIELSTYSSSWHAVNKHRCIISWLLSYDTVLLVAIQSTKCYSRLSPSIPCDASISQGPCIAILLLTNVKLATVRVFIRFPNEFFTNQTVFAKLHVLKVELRCKLQEKLHRVTEPLRSNNWTVSAFFTFRLVITIVLPKMRSYT
jgi:hypothetical protein